MAWQNESDKLVQDNWETRSAKKRDELSRSIEETLADGSFLQDPFSDEEAEPVQVSQNSMIIPPKLSLQSKSMPVVRVEPTEVSSVTPNPTTDAVSVLPTAQKKRRLAGRTTKVQLQAVPRNEKKPADKISIVAEKSSIGSESEKQINGKKTSKRQSSAERRTAPKEKVDEVVSKSLAGSGLVKQGQRDVLVMNNHISSSSVVNVSLVEDAGPVVVKYISLHPQMGFTLHFSDCAELSARFNYVILMGELF